MGKWTNPNDFDFAQPTGRILAFRGPKSRRRIQTKKRARSRSIPRSNNFGRRFNRRLIGFFIVIFFAALWGFWQAGQNMENGAENSSKSWRISDIADANLRPRPDDETPDPSETGGEGTTNSVSVSFGFCHSGGGQNCVVDGDTFWFQGEKIRLADIDTPETHPPRCPAEAQLGAAATQRLQSLLNSGPIKLVAPDDRDHDRYGRKLRIAQRDGRSIGSILVSEGLARPYSGGPRAGWCDG
jgi:micrococcal nuclease